MGAFRTRATHATAAGDTKVSGLGGEAFVESSDDSLIVRSGSYVIQVQYRRVDISTRLDEAVIAALH